MAVNKMRFHAKNLKRLARLPKYSLIKSHRYGEDGNKNYSDYENGKWILRFPNAVMYVRSNYKNNIFNLNLTMYPESGVTDSVGEKIFGISINAADDSKNDLVGLDLVKTDNDQDRDNMSSNLSAVNPAKIEAYSNNAKIVEFVWNTDNRIYFIINSQLFYLDLKDKDDINHPYGAVSTSLTRITLTSDGEDYNYLDPSKNGYGFKSSNYVGANERFHNWTDHSKEGIVTAIIYDTILFIDYIHSTMNYFSKSNLDDLDGNYAAVPDSTDQEDYSVNFIEDGSGRGVTVDNRLLPHIPGEGNRTFLSNATRDYDNDDFSRILLGSNKTESYYAISENKMATFPFQYSDEYIFTGWFRGNTQVLLRVNDQTYSPLAVDRYEWRQMQVKFKFAQNATSYIRINGDNGAGPFDKHIHSTDGSSPYFEYRDLAIRKVKPKEYFYAPLSTAEVIFDKNDPRIYASYDYYEYTEDFSNYVSNGKENWRYAFFTQRNFSSKNRNQDNFSDNKYKYSDPDRATPISLKREFTYNRYQGKSASSDPNWKKFLGTVNTDSFPTHNYEINPAYEDWLEKPMDSGAVNQYPYQTGFSNQTNLYAFHFTQDSKTHMFNFYMSNHSPYNNLNSGTSIDEAAKNVSVLSNMGESYSVLGDNPQTDQFYHGNASKKYGPAGTAMVKETAFRSNPKNHPWVLNISAMAYNPVNSDMYLAVQNGYLYKATQPNTSSSYTIDINHPVMKEPKKIEKMSIFGNKLFAMSPTEISVIDLSNTDNVNNQGLHTHRIPQLKAIYGSFSDFYVDGSFIFASEYGESIDVFKHGDIPEVQIPKIENPFSEYDKTSDGLYGIVEKTSRNENSQRYYMDTRVKVTFPNKPQSPVQGNYRIMLSLRDSDTAIRDIKESGLYTNVYIPLDDFYTDIEKEKNFNLSPGQINYTLIDQTDPDNIIQYVGVPDDVNPIKKINVKDVYYYEGNIYFRLRYLLNNLDKDISTFLLIGYEDKYALIYNDNSVKDKVENIKNSPEFSGKINSVFGPDDINDMEHQYDWFMIRNVTYSQTPVFDFRLIDAKTNVVYERYNDIDRKLVSDMRYANPDESLSKLAQSIRKVKWLDSDGSFHKMEGLLLNGINNHPDTMGVFDTIGSISNEKLNNRVLDKYPEVGENILLKSDIKLSNNVTKFNPYISYPMSVSYPMSKISEKGDSLTLSIYVSIKNITKIAPSGYRRLLFEISQPRKNDPNKIYLGVSTDVISSSMKIGGSYSGRISRTYRPDLFSNIIETTDIFGGIYIQGIQADYLEVSKPKIEIGKIATNWTPAPSDSPSYPINRNPYIGSGRFINDERSAGLIDMSQSYSNKEYLGQSRYMETYFNGRKVPDYAYIYDDHNDGLINSYIRYRQVRSMVDLDSTGSKLDPSTIVITDLIRKPKVENQTVIANHTITNEFEDQSNMSQVLGIYVDSTVLENLDPNTLSLYILKKNGSILHQFLSKFYRIYIDTESNALRVTMMNDALLSEGTEIFIVKNSFGDKTINLTGSNMKEGTVLSNIPLIFNGIEGYQSTTHSYSPDDFQVIVNGYTLIPNLDYQVFESDDSDPNFGNIPSMLTLKGELPISQDTFITITMNDSSENKTFSWDKPAVGTNDIFSLDDERWTFIPGSYEVYVNNLRIPSSSVKVIDHRSIQITAKDYYSTLINVMVKFVYTPHVNTKLAVDFYKYSKVDLGDVYYHTKLSSNTTRSNFDKLLSSTLSGDTDINEPNSSNDLRIAKLIRDIHTKPAVVVPTHIYSDTEEKVMEITRTWNKKISDLVSANNALAVEIQNFLDQLDDENNLYQANIDRLNNDLNIKVDELKKQISDIRKKIQSNTTLYKETYQKYQELLLQGDFVQANILFNKARDLLAENVKLENQAVDLESQLADIEMNYKSRLEAEETRHKIKVDALNKVIAEDRQKINDNNSLIENYKSQMKHEIQNEYDEQQKLIDAIPAVSDGSHMKTINANEGGLDWNVFISGQPVVNEYLQFNTFLDMNEVLDWQIHHQGWADPEI